MGGYRMGSGRKKRVTKKRQLAIFVEPEVHKAFVTEALRRGLSYPALFTLALERAGVYAPATGAEPLEVCTELPDPPEVCTESPEEKELPQQPQPPPATETPKPRRSGMDWVNG